MKKYLILVSIILFAACAGTKTTVTKTKVAEVTKTVTESIRLDTTIIIAAQKASLFIPIEKFRFNIPEKPKVFIQEKGRSKVIVKIDSTGITAISNCDSIAQQLQFYKKKITALTTKKSETVVKEKIKKGYSFLELLLYVTAFSIVSFVAGYLIKTFKII
jgi:hypothetical protein